MRVGWMGRIVMGVAVLLWNVCGAAKAEAQNAPAGLQVWAIGEGVRINPLTGKAFEENAKMLPGGLSGDYRARNWVWDGATRTVSLKGAANEVLGFQIIIEGSGVKGITLTATELTGPGAIPANHLAFFRAFYIHVKQEADNKRAPFPLEEGWYPDPLVPVDTPKLGSPFAIDGSNFGGSSKPSGVINQTVWCDLWIPRKTPKGLYTGKIVVTCEGGKTELNLNLEVFGFELPDENHTVLEFMSYTGFAWLKQEARDAMYIVTQQHRATITNTKPIVGYSPELAARDGKLVWEGFDKSWGPAIDGTLYKEGPRAGTPLDYFNLPFDPQLNRPDAKGAGRGRNWPIPSPTRNNKLEVDFTPEYVAQFKALLCDASAHFARKYSRTTIVVFQDALDEPGFHKGTRESALGQFRSIRGYVDIFNELKLPNVKYKLDIGGGFRNKYDLDGDGECDGSRELVKALAGTDLWNVHGMCVDLDVLRPAIEMGAMVWFYNGFEPRVGPTVIAGEGLGPRTWPWVVWNSDMQGCCVWNFLFGAEKGNNAWENGGVTPGKKGNPHAGDALFVYPGDEIGLPDKAFASMRLKAFRRGMQDYEYFYLLAKTDGKKDRAKGFSTRVVRNPMGGNLDMKDFQDDAAGEETTVKVQGDQRHWSHKPEDFEKVRVEIGKLLSR